MYTQTLFPPKLPLHYDFGRDKMSGKFNRWGGWISQFNGVKKLHYYLRDGDRNTWQCEKGSFFCLNFSHWGMHEKIKDCHICFELWNSCYCGSCECSHASTGALPDERQKSFFRVPPMFMIWRLITKETRALHWNVGWKFVRATP